MVKENNIYYNHNQLAYCISDEDSMDFDGLLSETKKVPIYTAERRASHGLY